MSIRVMSAVWERSAHSGTELLMLLALADFSDDSGNSYPSVGTLAAKCRMKSRNANYVLQGLKESGELEVRLNEGPNGSNRYRIRLDALGQASPACAKPLQPIAPLQSLAPLQSIAPTPAKDCATPLQRIADKPSLNRQEPREGARARKPKETAIPDSFGISAGVRAWAAARGFGDLDAHLEHFTLKCKARGYMYADWDSAFKTAIRADWAELRAATATARSPLHANDNLSDF